MDGVTQQPTSGRVIGVSFMRETPAIFQRALARRFVAENVPVAYVDRGQRATKSVGHDVGVILTFLALSAASGVAYEAERGLFSRALSVLRGMLLEVPFRAELHVRGPLEVTEYILPNGPESMRALDAYLADHDEGRWPGGRLRWDPSAGWVREQSERSSNNLEAAVGRFGSLTEAQQVDWVAEQLQISRDYDALVAWTTRTLGDD